MIERVTTIISSGKVRTEKVAAITSLGPQQLPPLKFLELVRSHWCIENRSHWVRDVTYDEDRSQIRTGNAPRMMAILRNLAIAILRRLGFTSTPQGHRHFALPPFPPRAGRHRPVALPRPRSLHTLGQALPDYLDFTLSTRTTRDAPTPSLAPNPSTPQAPETLTGT